MAVKKPAAFTDRGTKASPTEEAGSIALPPSLLASDTKEPPRGFLNVGRRNLSEDELSTPAARRFLIAEIERLDQDCSELRTVRDLYHEQRIELAALKEALKSSRWTELLSFVCLSVGSAGLGAAPSYISVPAVAGLGWVFAVSALILVAVGVASRVWK